MSSDPKRLYGHSHATKHLPPVSKQARGEAMTEIPRFEDALPKPEVATADLPGIEVALDRLVDSLTGDQPLPIAVSAYIIVLTQRAHDLCLGVRVLCEHDLTAAAAGTLRPAVEALILVGWLATDPETRVARWHGEGERNVRAMVAKSSDAAAPERFQRIAAEVSPERSQQREDAIQTGKDLAGGAKPMPNVEAMAAEAMLGPTFWEAYQIAYRLLSAWQHHEHATFHEEFDGNAVTITDARFDASVIRGLAASVLAATLVIAGAFLHNDAVVAEATRIREALLPPKPPDGDGAPAPA